MAKVLRDAFRQQSRVCSSMGSPFMSRLMTLVADRIQPGTPLTDRLFQWPGDVSPTADCVPLRLAGALNALRLAGNTTLERVYPPHDQQASDEELWGAVEGAMTNTTSLEEIDMFLDQAPQTNEVRRSAVLIAASQWLTHRTKLPIRLSELGASAGLNLLFDKFRLDLNGEHYGPIDSPLCLSPEWHGSPGLPFKDTQVRIIERTGVDLNPLNPSTDGARLAAYIWADQPERLQRTEAAMALAVATADLSVAKGDAAEWLRWRMDHQKGTLHMEYSTVAFQYFPEDSKARIEALIEAAGATATPNSPLAWFMMEEDGSQHPALRMRFWPGDLRIDFGCADFHCRWVQWNDVPFDTGGCAH